MVELIGRIVETSIENDRILDEWRIPSPSAGLARRQAKANARIKGREGIENVSVEKIGKGSLPGQKIYIVTTSSER